MTPTHGCVFLQNHGPQPVQMPKLFKVCDFGKTMILPCANGKTFEGFPLLQRHRKCHVQTMVRALCKCQSF